MNAPINYNVPGVACPGCGALPDQQHLEECRERIDGPVWVDPLWCEECEDEICPACGGCNCPGRQCSGIHNGDGDDR